MSRGDASARDRILDAATRRVGSGGAHGLRVEQVAEDAGVSVPLLYYHFENRTRLVRAILDRGLRAFPAYAGAGRKGTGLLAVIRALQASLTDDPEVRLAGIVRGEAVAAAVYDEALRAGVLAGTDAWCGEIAVLIRAAQRDRSADPAVAAGRAAGQLTALVDGVRERWLAEVMDLAAARAMVERATRLLLAPSA